MKRIYASLMSFVFIFCLATSAYAQEKPVSVWVDGQKIQFNGSGPVTENGVTLVPLRAIFTALDIKLEWNSKTQTIVGTKEDLKVSLKLGSKIATTNSKKITLGAPPKVIKQTTYVPIRFISEATQYNVKWDKQARSITIQSKAKAEIVDKSSRGFIWKVENGESTVYLLGSIHVANEGMYPLHSSIEKAFAASDYLAVEIDLTQVKDVQMQKLLTEMGTYQDGTTLKDHIAPETYTKLYKILEENGVQKGALDMFEPWVISSTVDQLSSVTSNYDAAKGIDQYFMGKATELKKPILELESIDLQLNMLDQFSPKLQEELLLSSIEAYYEPTAISSLDSMWVEGNDATLLNITNQMAFNEEYNKAMLVDRNVGMANLINKYLKDTDKSTYFVVVGAAHMLGEHGIVKLLEEKGYTVTRQ